jgi:hypothetical protein
MEQQKKGRGGKRIGAGRTHKYGEPTINITFRVPISSKETIRNLVNAYLVSLVAPKKIYEPEDGC